MTATDLAPKSDREKYFQWAGRVDGLDVASGLVADGLGDDQLSSDIRETQYVIQSKIDAMMPKLIELRNGL